MKRTTRLIGVIAMAMTLAIAFSGIALASQPASTTPETETIDTTTVITCIGTMTEEEKFTWDSSNEDIINNPPLAPQPIVGLPGGEVVGHLEYNQDLAATDGVTMFTKIFEADTGDEPNLDTMKSIGYVAGEIGALSHDEEVNMGLVADWTPTATVVLCPFAPAAVPNLPASCEDVTMGSKLVVTEAKITTVAEVEMIDTPIKMHYEVVVGGLTEGSLAAGTGEVWMNVHAEDGSAAGFNPIPPAPAYWLGSELNYMEHTSVHGYFDLFKSMNYLSQITVP